MADILSLQVKDSSLTDVIANNPYYINIKGSVNICLIRCGQEIESCNDVYFSTMTNYGKILVLNPNTNKTVTCNIKLAYDTSNDNINNNGSGNYKFERAFFTVPSLHQLNGQIFDMETFLVFSSVQKNGNVLYTCLCTFSNGMSNIPQSNDWKLLNYKLMNELFVKNNIVPEVHGTNSISGSPNPVDLSAFIPQEGSRNFYDYTHPQNTKVNFRIFQTPLSVSNEVISTLKSKLTPGNVYTNFKNAISKVINPLDGLFFYFSEDLTNMYKSYKINDTSADTKESFNISESIIEEQEKFEKNDVYKKLETSKIEEEEKEESKLENKLEEDKPEDTFSNNDNKTNLSITFIIFIFSVLLILNYGSTYILTNIFTSAENLNSDNLKTSINSISPQMNVILGTRFKLYFNFILQSIFTIILTLILSFSIISNNDNDNVSNGSIIFFSVFIFLNGISLLLLNLRYVYNRLQNISDDDFSQKENYLTKYIFSKIYKKGNILSNIWNIFIMEKFENISDINVTKYQHPVVNQSGGEYKIDHAPGPLNYNSNNKKKKEEDFQLMLSGKDNSFFSNIKIFYNLLTSELFRQKLSENPKWGKNITVYLIFTILFYIIILVLTSYFLSTNYDNYGVNIIIRLITLIFIYTPTIILPNLLNCYYDNKDSFKILRYIILGLSLVGFLFYFVAILIPTYISNIFIYTSSVIVAFSYAILLILYLFREHLKELIQKWGGTGNGSGTGNGNGSGNGSGNSFGTDSSNLIGTTPVNNEYILKLIEEKNSAIEKTRLLEEQINILKLETPDLSSQLQNEKDKGKLLNAEIERLKDIEQSSISSTNYFKLKDNLQNKDEKIKLLESSLEQKTVDQTKNPSTNNYIRLKQELQNKDDKIKLLESFIEQNPDSQTADPSQKQNPGDQTADQFQKQNPGDKTADQFQKKNSADQTADPSQKQNPGDKTADPSQQQNVISPNYNSSDTNSNNISKIKEHINKLTLLALANRQNIKEKYINMIINILSTLNKITDLNENISKNKKIIAIIDKLLSKEPIDYLNINDDIANLDYNPSDEILVNQLKGILTNIKVDLSKLTSSSS